MSEDTSNSASAALYREGDHRRRPPAEFDLAERLHTLRQIGLALLTFAVIGWLIWRGALAMEYNWQWYRVEPFFYRVIDGARNLRTYCR